jgi:hypothetical protein
MIARPNPLPAFVVGFHRTLKVLPHQEVVRHAAEV